MATPSGASGRCAAGEGAGAAQPQLLLFARGAETADRIMRAPTAKAGSQDTDPMPRAPSSFRVQLVSKPGSPATGIGRYRAELERGLRGVGADVRDAPLRSAVPASVARVARRTGYDLEAFGRSYPLRADLA